MIGINYYLFVFALIFGFHGTASIEINSSKILIDWGDHVYPVLKGKDKNQFAQLKIFNEGREAVPLNQITLTLVNAENINDIDSFNIYLSLQPEELLPGKIFGDSNNAGKSIVFHGNESILPGENYLWITCSLTDKASLRRNISIKCSELIISKKKVDPQLPPITRQVGWALRQHQDDDVDTYRIPGLVTTNRGTLIAVYDIRRNSSVDLQEDIDVGMQRSTNAGETWSPMQLIMDMGEWGGKPQGENGIGDPSILVDKVTNTIWVAGVWAHGHPDERNWWASKPGLDPEETSQFMLVKSEDDGVNWSEPINITQQIKDPSWHLLLQGPGKGITTKDGTLVFPAQFKDADQMPHATIIYSKDRGETWNIGTGAKSNTTEAQVVELRDGSLMLNIRDNRGSGPQGPNGEGARSVMVTKNLGKTWEKHPSSGYALPEPVCMASLIQHNIDDKTILIFSNPANTFSRQDMTIKISFDEGLTWPSKYHTLIDNRRGRGYSCLTSIDEETIGILYEGSQADLIFQKFKLEELLNN
ncbi:MAG: exo-alpha-sialidase [Saprospiraceae bacterium]|nr:exo-alpha-sialidase [Saprospiraceae bacterium]